MSGPERWYGQAVMVGVSTDYPTGKIEVEADNRMGVIDLLAQKMRDDVGTVFYIVRVAQGDNGPPW